MQWATSEDWERWKDEICIVYQQGTLRELMDHMERMHNFRATCVYFRDPKDMHGRSTNASR